MVTLCNIYNDDMYNNGLVFDIFYINRRSTDSTKEKPLVVHEYNHYMLGVDKHDQLMAYYSFLHKSIKWWRKVFFLDARSGCCECIYHIYLYIFI